MKKHKRKEFGLPALLIMGSGFALATVIVTSLILAIIAYLGKDPTALTGAFSLLAPALAGVVSGFITSKANGEGGTLVSVISAVISAVVMLSLGLILRKGLLPLGAVLNIAVFVVLSCFSALLAKRGKGARKRKYR